MPLWLGPALIAGPILPGVCPAVVDAFWNVNASGNWSVASNWTSNPLIPNGVGDQAKFIRDSAFTLTVTQNVPGLTLGAMQFNNGSTFRIVGTNAITMANSAPNAVLTVGGSVGHGAHEIATNVVLNNPLAVSQGSMGEFTFSGAISGDGGLIKQGPQSLLLTGSTANTFTGDVRVNAGTLRLIKNVNANAIAGNLIVGDDVGGANADVAIVGNDALPQTCNVTLNSSGWLQVLSPHLVQNLTMKSGRITIGGGGPSLLLGGQLQTIAHADPATISGPGSFSPFGGTKILNVADGAPASDLIISAPITTGGIDKRGAGTLLLSGVNTYAGSTIVREGRLVLDASMRHSGQWTLEGDATAALTPGGSKIIKAPTLTLTGSARLDLGDGKLITRGAIGSWDGSAYTGITGLIQSGRNEGTWNGPGIITSIPETLTDYTTLAVATADELGRVGETFGGIALNSGDVLVAYTYGGDANLDGMLNIDDYGQIDLNVGLSGVVFGYFNGDFNYDGLINIDDYGMMDFNFGIQGPPIEMNGVDAVAAAASGATLVPEPAAMSALSIGLLMLRPRHPRRRRRSG